MVRRLVMLTLLLAAAPAGAQGFVTDQFGRAAWQPLLPERGPGLAHAAYDNDLDKAETEVFVGRSRAALMRLFESGDDSPRAILLRAKAAHEMAWFDVAKQFANHETLADDSAARLVAIEAAFELGQWDEAITRLEALLDDEPDLIKARLLLAKFLEARGRLAEAVDA